MCVTTIRNTNLPDFARPPIVETALSVQFQRLEQLAIPHFGVFWQSIRRVYPRFQVHPPLNQVFERFGEQSVSSPQVSIEELSSPPVRCWFMDASENRLLQIQNDRFIHNWRKVRIDDEYPRYTAVRLTFETAWNSLCAFLASENLGIPQPNQCEVIYVNHIERVDKQRRQDDHGRVGHRGQLLPAHRCPRRVQLLRRRQRPAQLQVWRPAHRRPIPICGLLHRPP